MGTKAIINNKVTSNLLLRRESGEVVEFAPILTFLSVLPFFLHKIRKKDEDDNKKRIMKLVKREKMKKRDKK